MIDSISQIEQSHDRVVPYSSLKTEYGVPYTRVHLLRLEKAGKFPKRFRVGGRKVARFARELRAWLEERSASRTENGA